MLRRLCVPALQGLCCARCARFIFKCRLSGQREAVRKQAVWDTGVQWGNFGALRQDLLRAKPWFEASLSDCLQGCLSRAQRNEQSLAKHCHNMDLATLAVHAGEVPRVDGSITFPIFQTSTFICEPGNSRYTRW
jgi:hypothetical protein